MAAGSGELEARFRREIKEKTRTSARYAGLIAAIAFPAWAGFDYLVEPDNAADFALLRLAFDVPMVLLVIALYSPLGKRYPELLMLGILAMVEISIAIMISRVEEQFAAYSLGMSLALYASAFVLVWSWRYTAALIAISFSALGARDRERARAARELVDRDRGLLRGNRVRARARRPAASRGASPGASSRAATRSKPSRSAPGS